MDPADFKNTPCDGAFPKNLRFLVNDRYLSASYARKYPAKYTTQVKTLLDLSAFCILGNLKQHPDARKLGLPTFLAHYVQSNNLCCRFR